MDCVTENNVADCSAMVSMSPLIPSSVERVYADGAYDTSRCRQALARLDIEPIIPPQKNAVVKETRGSLWRQCRNDAIAEILGLGGDESGRSLWKKLKRYHRRSLAETAMFRLKALFGGSLRARTIPNQRAEILACCLAVNKMNRLGMPKGEWILV